MDAVPPSTPQEETLLTTDPEMDAEEEVTSLGMMNVGGEREGSKD